MNRMQQMVQEFQDKYKHNNNKIPTLTSDELNEFRQKLLDEEIQELKDALAAKDIIEVADALGDMLYVIFGTCCSHGIDIEPIFEEIHRSNMTKDYSKGECKKQIKGPDYSKPDIEFEIVKQKNKLIDGLIIYPEHWPKSYNSNIPCDMADGPCCCGAWHSLKEFRQHIVKYGMNNESK